MRVLSKAELNHSILLKDLQTVMENFGVLQDSPEEKPTQEEVETKKKKKNKQKQLKEYVVKEDGTVFFTIIEVLIKCNFDITKIQEIIKLKQYEQLVKSKKKEIKMFLIEEDAFVKVI